jgi:predicted HTH domain antitoxin
MILTIPDDIVEAAGISETELMQEIAILLFRDYKITLAKASHLAGMNQLQFMRLLGSRQIPIHYGMEEFQEDLQTLENMGW